MLLNLHHESQKSIIEKNMLGIVVVYVSISTLDMLDCRKHIKDFKERSERVLYEVIHLLLEPQRIDTFFADVLIRALVKLKPHQIKLL